MLYKFTLIANKIKNEGIISFYKISQSIIKWDI